MGGGVQVFMKTKTCLAKYLNFSLLLVKRHQKKKLQFYLESPVPLRSARVNKSSYKKPFTFPSYKIYLWGILPGKSLTETKDCLARMSWLGSIQNMWPVHASGSHSQGPVVMCLALCFLSSSMTFTWWSPIRDPLENTGNGVMWVVLLFWLSYHYPSLESTTCPIFEHFSAKWPLWIIKGGGRGPEMSAI